MHRVSFVSFVALVALMHSSFSACAVVLSIARPEYKNFPQTLWILLFNFLSSGFSVSFFAYCTFFPYSGRLNFV